MNCCILDIIYTIYTGQTQDASAYCNPDCTALPSDEDGLSGHSSVNFDEDERSIISLHSSSSEVHLSK